MKPYVLLLAGSLLLTGTAQAQTSFSIGPRIGGNSTTAHVPNGYADYSYTSRGGGEAGLTGTVQFEHVALQPSLLFAQKGYRAAGPVVYLTVYDPLTVKEDLRLNYLTLPVNITYTPGRAGQGVQVFAGPYVSLLVGGNYTKQYASTGVTYPEVTNKVKAGSLVSTNDDYYSQRVDGGLQAGLGYRLGSWQLQAGYSMGLRNLAVQYQSPLTGNISDEPAYYNRCWQLSLSYLVGPKS